MFSDQLITSLKNATHVAVLTGAGISAESGVPTFRGKEGLWKNFRPEELANFNAFIRNPELVWEWYNYRKELISEVEPNPGHYALVELEKRYDCFSLITQNVDNLHRLAGSIEIHELHGNIMRSRCSDCGKQIQDIEFEKGHVPKCNSCSGLVRPDIVWFGEMLPQQVIYAASEASEQSQVFLSVGTSGVVHPAASLPVLAKQNGAYVVEINIERTILSDTMDEVILGKSGEILAELLGELQ